ncbi:hypothetical protein MCY_00902 [Bartonella rattimassiliensis 15908]|uniref:Uncharacterized protein n=1 Tax=Bartonella rattimassiliensis 15908 TaxID=1094556 RepID=J1JP11_9HYPH|nr:hypothetical protein MCY_00902 [Bartonella rattimassiliensis 15908]
MKSYTLSDVAQYVDTHSHVINFGTQDNAPDDGRIKTAENTLDLRFTSSYKSFFKIMEEEKLEVKKYSVFMKSVLVFLLVILFTEICLIEEMAL